MNEVGGDNVYQMPAAEIVGVLQDILPEVEAATMVGMDQPQAIIFLSKFLVEHGVEEPEVYLKEKGILW